ncbi:MAG: iron-containing alcohol dehydrogenase [Kiritimatiellae bacterium]|nr:iron-containing alcohol dehydrogenase [Kiritimatiellia bacterium]
MLGNFTYENATRLHFGEKAMEKLGEELAKFGPVVQLSYGGGSIKKNGIYDQVMAALEAAGKTVVDDGGVMPNPTLERVLEGAKRARENNVDLILAVGGGSTIDYAKAVSVSAWFDGDPWETYFLKMEEPAEGARLVPVGSVLTMVGTGSEMNGGSVVTNPAQGVKIGKVFGPAAFPKFAILNPRFTFTVPRRQMVAGIFDIMSHILEQYFSGEDDNTSDDIAEGLMRSLVKASRAAVANPEDYEARSNIMWTATWALNTLIAMGKTTDWEVHMLGQAVGAITDATHGMTLSAVSLPYYRRILPYGEAKFARFATAVWGVDAAGKSRREVAEAGLKALEGWMREIGVAMNISELGADEGMIPKIADATFILDGGYKTLTKEEVVEILKESLG